MAEVLEPRRARAKGAPALLRDHEAPALFVAVAGSALLDGGAISAGAIYDSDELATVLVADLVLPAAHVNQEPALIVAVGVLPLFELHAVGGRLVGHIQDFVAGYVGQAK